MIKVFEKKNWWYSFLNDAVPILEFTVFYNKQQAILIFYVDVNRDVFMNEITEDLMQTNEFQ